MLWFKKFTSISLTALVLLFFTAPMLNSCGTKNKSSESTEQGTEEGDEHPSDSAEHVAGDQEHPTSDTTNTQ
ncbi:MAG TPA: hypothetical protein VI583_12830 [Cyclobacteriaceae bacterium]|jgi:hypothetical protein|nr:hypothetical protein [Cyclobacteriaceae bacterium]